MNIFCSLVDNRALSTLSIQNSVVENEDNYIVKSDDEQHESYLTYLYGVLDKVFWNSMYLILYYIINKILILLIII